MALKLKICCKLFELTKENVAELSESKKYKCQDCGKEKSIEEIDKIFGFAKFMFGQDGETAEQGLNDFLA